MIDKKKFENLNFQQHEDSCVIASYAVASQAFISKYNLEDYFCAFCKHYGHDLSEQCRKHSEMCATYIFIREYNKPRMNGYSVVKEVHENSQIEFFENCRAHFSLEWINISTQRSLLLETLRDEASCSMLFINRNFNGLVKSSHSITLFYDDGLWFYDTNKPGIIKINGLDGFGELGHCFLVKGL